jgi:hypothetical protein
METTDFQMEMKTVITGTEKKTFSVSRVWDASKPSCIVVELYPTLSINTANVATMDLSTLHLLTHIKELGDFGSTDIINLYSTVFQTKPSARKLKVDEENLAWIEKRFDTCGKDTTVILAYGNSLASNEATTESKLAVLNLLKRRKINAKCIVTESLENDTSFFHPLYLGLRHGNEHWKLEDVLLERAITELKKRKGGKSENEETAEKKRGRKKRVLPRESPEF